MEKGMFSCSTIVRARSCFQSSMTCTARLISTLANMPLGLSYERCFASKILRTPASVVALTA